MLKNLSIRTKLYSMAILSVIAVVLLSKVVMQNREIEKKATSERNQEVIKRKTEENLETIKESNLEEEKKIKREMQREETKKNAEEKQNALEEKYKKGYEAFHAKKFEEAINLEAEVIMENNAFYKAYTVKGIALCYAGKYEEGMADINKALEFKTDFGYGRFNKALAHELFGQYEEALIAYDKALEVENFVWSHYGKASIYGRRGDVENTIKNLKIAIGMEENVKEEARKESDFDPVRESIEFQELIK